MTWLHHRRAAVHSALDGRLHFIQTWKFRGLWFESMARIMVMNKQSVRCQACVTRAASKLALPASPRKRAVLMVMHESGKRAVVKVTTCQRGWDEPQL